MFSNSSSNTSLSLLINTRGMMKSLYFGAAISPLMEQAASQSQDSRLPPLLLLPFEFIKRVAVVLDQGALFRGNKEGVIRKKIIEHDLVECVISLPEKLFYNTSAPGAILVFNMAKSEKSKNRILFINASNLFGKHKEIRRLNQLYPEHIDKVISALESFETIEGLAAVRSKEEILKQDGNLNVTLYVSQINDEEKIDIRNVLSEISNADSQLKDIDKKLNSYLKELGYID